MVSSDCKKSAKKMLSGKWGKAVLISLICFIISIVLSLIEDYTPSTISSIASLISVVISVPFSLGLTIAFYKMYNNEEIHPFDFIKFGFNNFGKAWGIVLKVFFRTLLPLIVIILSVIIMLVSLYGIVGFDLTSTVEMSDITNHIQPTITTFMGLVLYILGIFWYVTELYYYQLAEYVLADDLTKSAKEAVSESKKIMNKKRWKLFCLEFSFIGWIILTILTLGIGFLWLLPYIMFAKIAFFKKFADKNNEKE